VRLRAISWATSLATGVSAMGCAAAIVFLGLQSASHRMLQCSSGFGRV
jgi:hypothetical protein